MTETTSSRLFVGRQAEMATLVAGLERAEGSSPGVIVVAGDAGVGKSRLLDEFGALAVARDARVSIGGCLQIAESRLPLVALGEALRQLVRDLGVEHVRRVAGETSRSLASLVPALGRGHPRQHTKPLGSEGGEAGQAQLFEAVLQLLSRLGEERTTVLVIEDLHWADQATRDLLVFLAHNLRDANVLVVATHRLDELEPGHVLRPVLAELARGHRVRQVTLSPFDREEVEVHLEAILASVPRRELVDQVLARSQGNPFFIEELVASGRVAGPSALPESLREMILTSLDVLPASTRQVLRLISCAGRRIDHRLLAVASDLDGQELDEAVRHAVNRRILLAEPDRGSYAFRHALFAEAIASTLLLGEGQRLHRRLAEGIETDRSLASEAPAGELAIHWAAAADRARTLSASIEAAHEATQRRALGDAREHVERVLATWSLVEQPEEETGLSRPEVVAWLAELAHLRGDAVASAALYAEAIATSSGVSPATVGLWHLRLAGCHEEQGDAAAAAQALQTAIALVPSSPASSERVEVLTSAAAELWESDPARGVSLGEEALEMARSLQVPGLEAAALTAIGACLAHLGHLDEALDRLGVARRLLDDGDAVAIARSHIRTSAVMIRGGRASAGADDALQGLTRVRESGVERLFGPYLAANATSGLFWAGRWDEAGALLKEAAGTDADGFLVLLQARWHAHRGDVDRARELLGSVASEAARRNPRWPAVAVATLALGRSRDLDAARAIIGERTTFAEPAHAATVNELRAWGLRVEADSGDPDRALCDALLAETTDERSAGVAHATPWRLTAVAEHGRCVGSTDPAPWEAALAAWTTLQWPHMVAYASARLAERLLPHGDDEGRAADLIADAHATATRLGAVPLAEEVSALARRAGVELATRGRRASPEGTHGLTPREIEVLALVAEGHSNRAIGERLFISQKTASVHVSNILRKLDVGGRTEAATLALRRGLVEI